MVTLLEKTVPLRKGTRVRAARDLPRVPEGTKGKVKLTNGTHWLRYWVLFENGEWVAHIDHADLVPDKEWADYLHRRESGELTATAGTDAGAAPEGDGAGTADTGEGITLPSGVVIPALLVDRTRKALAKAGNPRTI